MWVEHGVLDTRYSPQRRRNLGSVGGRPSSLESRRRGGSPLVRWLSLAVIGLAIACDSLPLSVDKDSGGATGDRYASPVPGAFEVGQLSPKGEGGAGATSND